NQQECIKIVDHYSIKKLFKQSDFIISLNSQGLLEAAFDGIKPIQLGNAFYGKKGFTYDYDFLDIDQLVNDLVVNKLTPTLSLEEFDLFEEFITILLQKHAVSIHASGVSVLSRKFNLPTIIPLVENVPKEKSKTTLPTQKDVVKKENTTIVNMVELPKVVPQSDKNRKYQKFRNNPRQFFADSRNPVIRSLMYFFPYK
ncbi:capsule biosynthesis protein, partial [Actinobacillus pleuropneumoniae]|nr:capsule biosynthesis protein [Actinobacillus pleuropneumoniae]